MEKTNNGSGYANGYSDGRQAGKSEGYITRNDELVKMVEDLRKNQYSERGINYDDGYYDGLTDLLTKLKEDKK